MIRISRTAIVAALVALPLLADASDFRLLEEKSAGTVWTVEWTGTPGPAFEYVSVPFAGADESALGSLFGPSDVNQEALALHDRQVVADSAVTSCLIAVRDPFASYAVSARDRSGTDVSAAVSAAPAAVGAIDAIRVVVDTSLLPEDSSPIRIDVAPATKSARNASRAGVRIGGQEFLRGLFVNGETLADTSAAKGAPPALPEPPGDWRLEYDAVEDARPLDGEILAFSLTDIGYNASDLSELRFVYSGAAIPFEQSNGNGVYLYAPRTHTSYNPTDSVFAGLSPASPSPRIATREAFPTLAPLGAEVSIPRSVTVSDNSRYERDGIAAAGERFVAARTQAGQTLVDTVTVHDRLTTTGLRLEARLQGLNQVLTLDPDHYADLSIDNVALPRDSWNDRTDHVTSGTLQLPAIPAPHATLTFRHFVPTDTPVVMPPVSLTDIQNLESYTIEWQGKPRIDNDGVCRIDLADAGGTPRLVTVGGFPGGTSANDVLVFDTTDPLGPVEVVNVSFFADEDGGVALEFEDAGNAARYHVQSVSSLQPPDAFVAAGTLPAVPLAGTPLRAIYVRPAEFAATIAPLVALRGPGVIELDPQAAYDVYSHGRTSPESIRLALADLIAASPETLPMPEVILAAHGTFDSRDYLDAWIGPKIPVWFELGSVEYNGSNREFPSDIPYSILFGGDDLPDVMLGRIAARTAPQLQNAVDRYIAYDAALATLMTEQRLGYVVTDHTEPQNFYFGLDAPQWTAVWETTQLPSDHLDFTDASAANVTITEKLEGPDGGVAFGLYVGHGNFEKWTSGRALDTDDVMNQVDVDGQWPVMAPLTCQNGLYAVPPVQETLLCLSDAWMIAVPTRGAIASVSITTEETYLALKPIVEEVMRGFSGHDGVVARTTGELFAMGLVAYLTKYPALADNARSYHLFGDPGAPMGFEYPENAAIDDWLTLGSLDDAE